MLTTPSEPLLHNILTQRRVNGRSNAAHKQTLFALMERSGSLAFTVQFLDALHIKLEERLEDLETKFGVKNYGLRRILRMLAV
jgi:hypothetical protein